MRRGEPTLFPEWYRLGNGSSSHSDEQGIGLTRTRLLVSSCDPDAPRLSSYRRSSSTNGSRSHYKDISPNLQPYSSFGRSHRERDLELHDTDIDSFSRNGTEKDTLRRTQSAFVSGRQVESWPKRQGKDSNSVVGSGAPTISGISKAFFERDFPSLGADEKQGLPDTGRVSSPRLVTAVQSLPIGGSAIIGGDGWTSALAEVPVVVGGNGSVLLSSLQTATLSQVSAAISNSAGLNMAEALAQAPSRVHAAPESSVDTQRIDELTLRQCKQLIPMIPSLPKTSGLNALEKPKFKGTRSGDTSGPSKGGQQLSSQLLVTNNTFRPPARSDIPKTSQAGNFEVLNREKNGVISPTAAAKDVIGLSAARAVNQLSNSPLKSAMNPKLKGESSRQSSFGEKRPLSQAQNRNDFFNSLRRKTCINHSSAATITELEKLGGETSRTACVSPVSINQEKDICGLENGDGRAGCEEPEMFVLFPGNDNDGGNEELCCVDPDEKEVAFLRSLGWEEDAGEEALTAEEIAAFVKEYEKLRPSSALSHRS